MPQPVHYLPLVTTLVALVFAAVILQRWRQKRAPHLLWWGIGVVLYGVGTAMESYVTLFGWDPLVFRTWYVAGALLGGAPLAQGTVYLLLKRRTAHVLSALLVGYLAVAATLVYVAPLDLALVEAHRLTGKVLAWPWVRLLSPLVNVYALAFLAGGAIVSALRFRKTGARDRMIGNVLIAVGAILPGIGGSFTRAGYTEVLYVMELLGLLAIAWGYHYNTRTRPAPATSKTRTWPTGPAARDAEPPR